MYRIGLLIIGLLAASVPGFFGDGEALREERGGDDPLVQVARALDQGRHWYAAQLLRNLDGAERQNPEALLLAAKADAGRGAWPSVARRLASEAWLDSIGSGAGRFLISRAWLETGRHEAAAEGYRAYLDYASKRADRARAEVGLARALAGLGEHDAAAAAYVRAADLSPRIAPWLRLRAAEDLALGGDTAAVLGLLSQSADHPQRRLQARVTAYASAGATDRAADLLIEAAAAPSTKSRSADLRASAARIFLQRGDSARARSTLRRAVSVQPSAALDAAQILSGLPDLTVEEHRLLGRAFERSGAPLEAVRHYRAHMAGQPLSPTERQRLQLKIGELLFRGGSYFIAVDELEQLIASRPPASLGAQAEYLAARATYRRGWRREGRERLQAVADRYPGTGSAIRALSLLGDLYESANKVEDARAIYETITEQYAGSRTAPRLRYRLGILAFLDGDYDTAQRHFDRLRSSSRWTDWKIRATYWAARSRAMSERPQDQAEADRLFRVVADRDPYGYYGLLAAERTGVDPWERLEPGPEPAPLDPDVEDRLAIVGLLRQAGLTDEAAYIVEQIAALRPRRPEELLGLSYALAEHGFGREAVIMGWRAHSRVRGLWSASVLRAVYPLTYEEIILAESTTRGVDPYLVAAIARQESAFSAEAVSRAGARGLLQLMPETGRWWAGRMQIRDYRPDLLFHPETNIHLGTAYYADLARRYGDIQLSLIAYNAGPTRARRWRERPEYKIDSELFAERIPFSETRTYVRNVQSHYRIYQHLYGGSAAVQTVD
jgi:soluble lytic murein transglycosylase